MRKKNKNWSHILERLPRHSYSIHNKPMEPITLIILGNKKSLLKQFSDAGWYLADPITFFSTLRSGLATLFNSSYHTGPMFPSFIDGKIHQLGFERPTRSDSYRRRHHLRLWKTPFHIGKKRIWIGTLSYDRSVGHFKGSLLPTHHICSKLDSEEHFLARTLRIPQPLYAHIGHKELGHINSGDPYIWDGKALVLDLSKR